MAEIEAKMATFVLARAPDTLLARGIGSCLIVMAYCREKKAGGMLHAMLPEKAGAHDDDAKYVDSGIDALISSLARQGMPLRSIEVKIAGAANMFPGMPLQPRMQIGQRNIESAKKKLSSLGAKLTGEDVGGSKGRTISFSLTTGKVEVQTSI